MIMKHRAVGCHRMDLIDVEPVPELGRGLGELGLERRDRVILDLVHGSLTPPFAHIAVAPLGRDGDVGDFRMGADPVRKEALGQPVRASAVEVTHAGGVRGVEDDTRLSVEVLDGPLGAELIARRGDVCGATESGQAETDPLHVADHTPAQMVRASSAPGMGCRSISWH